MFQLISLVVAIVAVVVAVVTPEIRQMFGLESTDNIEESQTLPPTKDKKPQQFWGEKTTESCKILKTDFMEDTASDCFFSQSLTIEDYCAWKWEDDVVRTCSYKSYKSRYDCKQKYLTQVTKSSLAACREHTALSLGILNIVDQKGGISAFTQEASASYKQLREELAIPFRGDGLSFMLNVEDVNAATTNLKCIESELSNPKIKVLTPNISKNKIKVCIQKYGQPPF